MNHETTIKALERHMRSITDTVQREGRKTLTAEESREYREAAAELEHLRSEVARSGRGNADIRAVTKSVSRVSGDDAGSGDWATRAAAAIAKANGGESRAIASGSLDLPSPISPRVTPKTRPTRLIDVLINRQSLDSGNAFSYWRQDTRTNNAAPVADLAEKPESAFNITEVEDRARVIAHLSTELPIRLWQDAEYAIKWLEAEMRSGVLDKVEQQIISGSGSGENMTGLLTVSGVTSVAYNTSVVVTLRKALTALENIGVVPTAWVLNPADIEAIDLLRYSIDPEADSPQRYLLDGYTNGTANSANIFGDSSIARVSSTSVPAGTAILGDFSQLRLLVREDLRLDIDAGGDLFKKNAAIMRAETRVGVAHLRPASFAKIDLTP